MADSKDNLPTDDVIVTPWRRTPGGSEPDGLHLIIAWLLNDPGRTGFVAPLNAACSFGRGEPDGGGQRLVFTEERPGLSFEAPPVTSTAISRRQLLFEPVGETAVKVQCAGKRALFHNGAFVAECVAEADDTLMLEDTAVLLVQRRPTSLPALRHYPRPEFFFGRADAHGLVGESPAMWALRDTLAAAAASGEHVLLLGPSGAGKELAASAVHALSPRRSGKFVARNAATMPASLLDAELFGSARNYPNPGSPEREGLIGAANGGTLLLDEIGELPEEHQAHLLRALDRHGEYHRLGESQARKSDFRLIGATNRGLGALKHDFLARFPMRIEVPGLDQRRSDIPFLMVELLSRMAAKSPQIAYQFCDGEDLRKPRIEPLLIDALLRHRYTQHLRELERLLWLSATKSTGAYLAVTPELELSFGDDADSDADEGQGVTRDALTQALALANGNLTKAGERLSLSRHAVRRLMKKYGLDGPR